ncbi:uncharacterized protein LOC107273044 [Cephus cinctus]|uniref:Uncharacterized protein LOC107273044 n=1 Tax=Cephus cinctus TaxID=211228 RepID=A0AAJ7CBC2_CEPCN|nr:uncharacterized protein LOC107273044 [Cephus cinctus]
MEKVIPMSWLNQMLLLLSIVSAVLSIIISEWFGNRSLPVYIPILWAIFITILSTWLSCFLLRLALKATTPINIELITGWIRDRLENYLTCNIETVAKSKGAIHNNKEVNDIQSTNVQRISNNVAKDDKGTQQLYCKQSQNELKTGKVDNASIIRKLDLDRLVIQIDVKFISSWYKNLSSDKTFPDEAKGLLRKLLNRLQHQVTSLDKIKLTSKLADVLLLHLKEYRRALRRVKKGTASNLEEAYRCVHPGSRSTTALEHTLHRLVTILAREFLQWELTSSLPCKLLLSILASRLLQGIHTASCPNLIYEKLVVLLSAAPTENGTTAVTNHGIVSQALGGGIASATAAVIPRPLPKQNSALSTSTDSKSENQTISSQNAERSSLCLEGLAISHRGLWGDVSISEPDSELDEDRLSPVYEEPTDFATTIARLRNLLQQKSTATTPLQVEEKSCTVYEGSQFTNLAIPWTEFYTAPDGSQQLLYCIQFDDVEQHGVDMFETTTATVRRQYSDFVQLHGSLEEVPSLSGIMSDMSLPEGGRVEMENYLKTLCTRLSIESPPQLRHFLRPSSGVGKKADVVVPRLDRFLAKTVSGMFNTLKTVVPGFEMDQEEDVVPLPTLMPLADIPWRFVEDVKSRSVAVELQQLVAERIDYCSVDTAYEAVDSVEGSGDSELLSHWLDTVNTPYDEELEELDCNLTLTRVSIDLICEVLAGIGSNNTLQQEAVVRWTKLLFGNVIEPVLQNIILRLSNKFSNLTLFSTSQTDESKESIDSLKEKLVRLLMDKIPSDVKLLVGEDDMREGLRFLLGSLEVKKINQDFSLQILDVLASQLLASCRSDHHNSTP